MMIMKTVWILVLFVLTTLNVKPPITWAIAYAISFMKEILMEKDVKSMVSILDVLSFHIIMYVLPYSCEHLGMPCTYIGLSTHDVVLW